VSPVPGLSHQWTYLFSPLGLTSCHTPLAMMHEPGIVCKHMILIKSINLQEAAHPDPIGPFSRQSPFFHLSFNLP
jgi:hypothetical protein